MLGFKFTILEIRAATAFSKAWPDEILNHGHKSRMISAQM